MADCSGLFPRAKALLLPGEVSDADGDACERAVARLGGDSDRSDACDLRERSEVRGNLPAVSNGELSES